MGDQYMDRDDTYDLGNQLLTLRTRIALTQIALASELGVHRRSVQKWESGLSYPKAELLQRLRRQRAELPKLRNHVRLIGVPQVECGLRPVDPSLIMGMRQA